MHESSFSKMVLFKEKYLAPLTGQKISILDVGSQDVNGSYKPIFEQDSWHYTGADIIPGENVDIILHDIYHWREIKSNSMDVVVTGQTFEHIEFFWLTILEIFRVLKPSGYGCIIAPASGGEHRYPVDCWRFYPDGFKSLCKFSGLTEMEAYTQWQPLNYRDGSDIWKDSVLICQKPLLTAADSLRFKLRNYLIKKACKITRTI